MPVILLLYLELIHDTAPIESINTHYKRLCFRFRSRHLAISNTCERHFYRQVLRNQEVARCEIWWTSCFFSGSQSFNSASNPGAGTRSAALFPLMGAYDNTASTSINITIQVTLHCQIAMKHLCAGIEQRWYREALQYYGQLWGCFTCKWGKIAPRLLGFRTLII